MLAWLDGRIVAPEEAHISIADRGLLLGDGVFETIAVHNGWAFALDAHLERLAAGLAVLGFAQAVDIPKLRANLENFVAAADTDRAVLRVTVTRGAGPRGLAPPETPCPVVFMTLSPMPPGCERPLSLHVATATRRNERSVLSRVKALPYLDNVLALSEARAHGTDDALILNTRGTIACAAAANVFVVRRGHLETPPLGDGALPGTLRALVLSLAAKAGMLPVEISLAVEDLGQADAVFLTNSISRIRTVGACGGTLLGGCAGAAVERLRALVSASFDAACPRRSPGSNNTAPKQ